MKNQNFNKLYRLIVDQYGNIVGDYYKPKPLEGVKIVRKSSKLKILKNIAR